MAATDVLGPFRLDAETDTLFRGGEPISLGHRAVREAQAALIRNLVRSLLRPGRTRFSRTAFSRNIRFSTGRRS